MDLFAHTQNAPDSGYVATSKLISVAVGFAGKNGFVYVICSGRGIDVNAALGPESGFPEQQEVAFPGGIYGPEIMGAFQMNGGVFTGTYAPNPSSPYQW